MLPLHELCGSPVKVGSLLQAAVLLWMLWMDCLRQVPSPAKPLTSLTTTTRVHLSPVLCPPNTLKRKGREGPVTPSSRRPRHAPSPVEALLTTQKDLHDTSQVMGAVCSAQAVCSACWRFVRVRVDACHADLALTTTQLGRDEPAPTPAPAPEAVPVTAPLSPDGSEVSPVCGTDREDSGALGHSLSWSHKDPAAATSDCMDRVHHPLASWHLMFADDRCPQHERGWPTFDDMCASDEVASW
jgi:hypothetical protein